MKQEDDEFFNKCLENLGLCEKKGLDGQIMLYPVKAKEKKLEKDDFSLMIKRLYKIKNNQEVELNNVRIKYPKFKINNFFFGIAK